VLLVQHAGVRVGGQHDAGVPELFLHRLQVSPGAVRQASRAVPQVVQPYRRKAGILHQATEPAGEEVRMQRRSVGGGEHVAALLPPLARRPLLGPLPAPMRTQRANGMPVQGDGAPARRGLRRADRHRVAVLLAPDPGGSLDDSYPLGGFVTHDLVGGDSRKVLIARSELVLSSGNHWVPGLRSGAPPLPVHHFKWRGGCQQYLAARMADFAASMRPAEVSMREECGRLLAHLRTHGGRLAVDGLAPATTAVLPAGWAEQAARVSDYWWRSRWLMKGGTR
jgi:hypothetical protein